MNESCKPIVPMIYRVSEGEATPDEAMRTARHLSDCTACRILLARERRLAAMLEEELADPLQVGEDFVRAVMDTLPHGPPPPARRKQRKSRILKLASLAGWIGLAPLLAAAQEAGRLPSGAVWRLTPELDVPLANGMAESVQRLGGLLVLALDRVATGLPLPGDLPLSVSMLSVLALVPVGLFGALASASVVALAMRRLLRAPSSGSA
jgi:anti-sigma factor RsiW